MSLLKVPPPEPVRSLEEMFALAHVLEREAVAKYTELAETARDEGNSELAALFDHLADEERRHEYSVAAWAERQSGALPDAAAMRWQPPQTFDEQATGDLARSHIATAYRVLSEAVRNEERAFALWSYIAGEAPTVEIRRAAEKMASEELRHVALLRSARRKAYHEARGGRPPAKRQSVAERLADAASLEQHLAALLNQLADRLANDTQVRARYFAAQAKLMAEEGRRLSGVEPAVAGLLAEDPLAVAEQVTDDYLDLAGLSRDESLTSQLQELGHHAIMRLSWLRGVLAPSVGAPLRTPSRTIRG